MTLLELYQQLEQHDWFHAMSDSHEVWQRGDANWNRLMTEAGKIEGGVDLMMAYSKHVFSGEAFGTTKQPKPEKPIEDIDRFPDSDSVPLDPAARRKA